MFCQQLQKSVAIMLKFIILSCLVVAVYSVSDAYREKAMDKLTDIAGECIPEVGASDDDVAELMEKKPPSRKEGKCLIACFSKKLGMTKDGKPDKDSAIAAFAPLKEDDAELYAKVEKMLDQCHEEMASETETDECELAFKAVACMHKKGEEMGVNADDLMG